MSFFSHNYVKNLTQPCHNDIILLVDAAQPHPEGRIAKRSRIGRIGINGDPIVFEGPGVRKTDSNDGFAVGVTGFFYGESIRGRRLWAQTASDGAKGFANVVATVGLVTMVGYANPTTILEMNIAPTIVGVIAARVRNCGLH
jgi:hypothetical protein